MERIAIPYRPWSHLGMDIMTVDRVDYLAIIDIYSKWLEIIKLTTKTAKEINSHLLDLFSNHGIPDRIYCDNNPFNSTECHKFAEEMSFDFIYSSPYYSQSNGQAEKAVDIAKKIVKKSNRDSTSLKIALLNYRSMQVNSLGATPAQLLLSRRLKTKLPIKEELLLPHLQQKVAEKLLNNQNKTAEYYNRTVDRCLFS